MGNYLKPTYRRHANTNSVVCYAVSTIYNVCTVARLLARVTGFSGYEVSERLWHCYQSGATLLLWNEMNRLFPPTPAIREICTTRCCVWPVSIGARLTRR